MKPGPKSQSPGGDILRSLYVDQQWSYDMLAAKYGVSKTCVMRWIRREGIEVRSPSERSSIGSPKRVITDEYREKLRVSLAKARTNAFTPEALAKRSEAMKGTPPPNKGQTWTPEIRATQMAVRTTDEYREKIAAAHRGEKNGQWSGGRYKDADLRTWTWKQARKACYERDNWTCQECGVKCHNGVRIQAHHIVPRRDGGGHELENLRTLCAGCHRKVEARVPRPGTSEYPDGTLSM